MNTKEIFAQRLMEVRESRGISRQELADTLGITRSSLEYYEKAKRTPDIGMISKIAKLFEVSTDYLLGLVEVSTTDIKKKEVCEYLGLSEPVVNRLKNYTSDRSKNIINGLLVAWEMSDFIGIIERRKKAILELIENTQNLREEISLKTRDVSKIKKSLRRKEFCQDELDLQTFRLTQSAKTWSDEYMRNELGLYEQEMKNLQECELYSAVMAFIDLEEYDQLCDKYKDGE